MLRVVRVLCEALQESVEEGKRNGVSRFITDDLPESVIQNLNLTKGALPDLGSDLLVFVLDNTSESRWTPSVTTSWNFVTEDDLAAARTELADTPTCILVVLPQGRNLAATMDSTTRKIDGVFEAVALAVGRYLGLNSPHVLHDVLNEIARQEGAGDVVEMDSVRWGALFDLDGITDANGFNDAVTSRLGLLSGTTEGNWQRSKMCWKKVVACVQKSGIYEAVESWVIQGRLEGASNRVEEALYDWRGHIVDRTNGDSTLFVRRPWGVNRCLGVPPSWYGVLNYESWSVLVDDKEREDVIEDPQFDWPNAVCQIQKSKTEKCQVYGADGLVFDKSGLSVTGEWLYGDEVINTIDAGDGLIQLQLPESSIAKELVYRDGSTGQVSCSRMCLGLSDQFPCVILLNNGVVKSWGPKKNIFKVKLDGVGRQRISIVLHAGWSIAGEKVIGVGVRTDIEGDENDVEFYKSNGFERDGLRYEEFDFDTDEDSELKFALVKEDLVFDVVVEVKAESSIASYEVESVWEELVHRNLNTKKFGRKIPQVAGEHTGMMDLQLMLWKYSWGFPVVISTDTLQFRLEGDDEQWKGFKSQVFSKVTLTGHMDVRGDQEVFREDCRKLLEIRERLMRCLGIGGEHKVVLEHLDLCQLDGLPELLEEYLLEYARLANESESENWRRFETVWLHAGAGKGSLTGKPSCMFLTPLHPLCLGWQYHSQRDLQETLNASKGCPQAALLSPADLPPYWGLKDIKYLPIETNLAYWRCYASEQKQVTDQVEVTEFLERELGIELKSMSTGLKANQVESALDQVSKIFAAQTGFVVSISGERMHSDVNVGLENWLLANCSNLGLDGNGGSPEVGRPLHATIYDTRQLPVQHFGAGKLGLLANDFGVELAYHTDGDESPDMVDIAFLTSLKTSDPDLRDKSGESCVDPLCVEGGLMRFGLSAIVHGESVETSLDLGFVFDEQEGGIGRPLSWCLRAVQDALSGGVPKSYLYAPEPELMRELLGKSEFVAVSSPLLDLDYLTGQDDMLVWQYAIPAYGESAGTNDGYFLISNTKDEYVKSLEAKLRTAGIELSQSHSACRSLISMAGKRGVLDLKRFLAGGAASVGEIGMLGAQLILDPGSYYDAWSGLLGAKTKDDFSLLVPVDPFEKRLNVLREAIGYKGHSRPDYFVIRFTEAEMFVSLVEVKWRSKSMSDSELNAVVKNQIHGFMGFLETLQGWQEKGGLWRRAFRVLLAEVTLFGLRLSMADGLIDSEVARSCMHTLGEVFANRMPIVLDPRKGRVIAFAQEGANQFLDLDKDGFPEILHVSLGQVINLFDPARIGKFKQTIGAGPKDWFEVPQSSGKVLTLENEEVHPVAAEPDQDRINSGWGEDAEVSADTGSGIGEENSWVLNDHETQPKPQNSDLSQEEAATDGEGICFAVGGASGVMGEMSYDYAPSNTALTQLNMGVVGDLGTGKTQLLKALMYQIARDPSRNRGVAPKFLVLDTKRDYGGNEGINGVMHDALGIKVIRPYNMPLNIFDIRGSKEFHPMMPKANFFVDILDKIHSGIGPIQQSNLFEAIQTAFEEKGYEPGMDFSNFEAPTLKDVFEAYASNGQKDSPYSIMNQLLMNKLFVEDASQAQSFSEFFSSSVVVSLGDIASMDKPLRLALVIFLNLYRDYMLNVEKRKYIGSDPQLRFVDSYVLIDEAKLIMDLDLQVLEDLLRKGREFGVGVVLSSQYPGDFKSKSMNYGEALATWFIHKVPKVTEKELEQLGFQNVAGLPQKIKTLEPHHCLYKSFGCNGEVIHATPYYKIVQGEGA